MDIALFQETKNVGIQNKNLGREEKGKLIETAGNMNLITPGRLIAGSYAASGDERSCVISTAAAESLLGSREAVGEEIKAGEEVYRVCGVVAADSRFCMIQGKEGKLYSGIRVEAPGIPLSVVQGRMAFLLSAGQEESGWKAECDLYLGIGRIFLYLPAWVLLLQLLVCCGRLWPGNARIVTAVSGFAGVCALALLSIRFSSDYIPSAWSDFSFFTQLFKEKTEDILTLIRKPLFYADSMMLGALAETAGASLLITLILSSYVKRYVVPYRITEDFPDDTRQSLRARRRPAGKPGFLRCISSSPAPGGWWRWWRYRERTTGRRS